MSTLHDIIAQRDARIAELEADRDESAGQLRTYARELQSRDERIAELEAERDALAQKVSDAEAAWQRAMEEDRRHDIEVWWEAQFETFMCAPPDGGFEHHSTPWEAYASLRDARKNEEGGT